MKLKSSLFSDEWPGIERQYNLRNAFLSVVQCHYMNENGIDGDDGVVFLLWVPATAGWKIVLVGVACGD